MDIEGYVACICEGSAEKAIINLLLENNKLIFNKKQMIDRQIITCRDAKSFEAKYLRKGFEHKITVYRILDSRSENFNVSKVYKEKIEVVNVITAPEIEMLIIFNENRYEDFKKSRLKPSTYCKKKLKYKDVKSYKFVQEYFENVDKLVESIEKYKRISCVKKDECTLCDLLKYKQ